MKKPIYIQHKHSLFDDQADYRLIFICNDKGESVYAGKLEVHRFPSGYKLLLLDEQSNVLVRHNINF